MTEEPQDDGLELECGDLDGERGELEKTIVLDDTLEEQILEKSDRVNSRSYAQVSFDPIDAAINAGYEDDFGFSPPRMSWNAGLDEPFNPQALDFDNEGQISSPNNPDLEPQSMLSRMSNFKRQSYETYETAGPSTQSKTSRISYVKTQTYEPFNLEPSNSGQGSVTYNPMSQNRDTFARLTQEYSDESSPPEATSNAVTDFQPYNEPGSTPTNPTSAIHDFFPSVSVVKQQSPAALKSAALNYAPLFNQKENVPNKHKTAFGFSRIPGRINLAEMSDPLIKPSQKGPLTIQDEFFGVYCLISRSTVPQYKNRCYVGYTVDPNRRIRQHNAGKQFGGAQKTDSKGPWDMVCIVHGFPNAVSALRFEWAWQNQDKSKRLRGAELKKSRNESPFAFRLRIACQMLNSDPWNRLALTFRWLLPECEIPFPAPLPKHVGVAYGKVQKVNTLVPDEINEYTTLNNCHLCERKIPQIKCFVRCLDFDNCCTHFHARCLAEYVLKEQDQLNELLVPLSGKCPKCAYSFLWGDLIRDQRMLSEIDEAKPRQEGVKVADGMIPLKITKK
ncbi:GIY-YIG catalytic domain-containing protein [Ditylenchus destructor]|nr:GIY-YIG catalytic domain-containing protein [Ditylenchus destructor]